jgi:small-conductance mechanosensitive channel
MLITEILHVTFAAAWFGHKLVIPRDLRQSIHSRHEHMGLIERVVRAERLGIVLGLGTLATGIALIVMTTGFAGTPLRIWLGLAAVIAIFMVWALMARPAWREVRSGLEANDLPHAVSRVGSLIGALRLEALLWILALTTMLL